MEEDSIETERKMRQAELDEEYPAHLKNEKFSEFWVDMPRKSKPQSR
jgi:hypothetical protein